MLAPSATLTVWTLLDIARGGKATAVGAATAIVVGLVAITPAAGFVEPAQRAAARRLAALPELLRHPLARQDEARRLARRRRRARRRRHGGRAADRRVRAEGLERRWPTACCSATRDQMRIQAIGVGAVIVYAALMTFVLLKVMGAVLALRAEAATKAWAWTSRSTAKRPTRAVKARSSCCPTSRRRRGALQARLANEGGKA